MLQVQQAEVIAMYTKNLSLNKENHRQVSILPMTLKIRERVLHEQVSEYLDDMCNPFSACVQKRLWIPDYSAAPTNMSILLQYSWICPRHFTVFLTIYCSQNCKHIEFHLTPHEKSKHNGVPVFTNVCSI